MVVTTLGCIGLVTAWLSVAVWTHRCRVLISARQTGAA